MSAKCGEGLDKVAGAIADVLKSEQTLAELVFAYNKSDLLEALKRRGNVISEEFKEEGIFVKAYLSGTDLGKYSEYITYYNDL